MKKQIRYFNGQIILPAPSVKFNFLEWLQNNKSFDKFYLRYAKEIVKGLGYETVAPSNEKKIISFADITFDSNLMDCDFLHFSKEYRAKVQYDNCSYQDSSMRESTARQSIWQYGLSLWDLSEVISKQLESPDEKILKSFNDFYLRANGGGVVRVTVHFQPKTKKRFAGSFFEIYPAKILDSGELSGRLFFGCGVVC